MATSEGRVNLQTVKTVITKKEPVPEIKPFAVGKDEDSALLDKILDDLKNPEGDYYIRVHRRGPRFWKGVELTRGYMFALYPPIADITEVDEVVKANSSGGGGQYDYLIHKQGEHKAVRVLQRSIDGIPKMAETEETEMSGADRYRKRQEELEAQFQAERTEKEIARKRKQLEDQDVGPSTPLSSLKIREDNTEMIELKHIIERLVDKLGAKEGDGTASIIVKSMETQSQMMMESMRQSVESSQRQTQVMLESLKLMMDAKKGDQGDKELLKTVLDMSGRQVEAITNALGVKAETDAEKLKSATDMIGLGAKLTSGAQTVEGTGNVILDTIQTLSLGLKAAFAKKGLTGDEAKKAEEAAAEAIKSAIPHIVSEVVSRVKTPALPEAKKEIIAEDAISKRKKVVNGIVRTMLSEMDERPLEPQWAEEAFSTLPEEIRKQVVQCDDLTKFIAVVAPYVDDSLVTEVAAKLQNDSTKKWLVNTVSSLVSAFKDVEGEKKEGEENGGE